MVDLFVSYATRERARADLARLPQTTGYDAIEANTRKMPAGTKDSRAGESRRYGTAAWPERNWATAPNQGLPRVGPPTSVVKKTRTEVREL